MPLVSVIIPTFNYSEFLPSAVDSALGQTVRDLEVLVIDDGSTDATRAVIARFSDHRLTYHYQDNRGLAAARNRGIRLASGKYLAFLDADDLWLPGKLERQLPLLEVGGRLGLVYGGYEVIDARGRVQAVRQPQAIEGDPLANLLLGNSVSGSATTSVVRAAVFSCVGLFDESLEAAEDWDMWLRIASLFSLGLVKTTVAQIRVHPANMSADPYRMDRSLQKVLDNFFRQPDLGRRYSHLERRARSRARVAAGVMASRRRKFRAARTLALKALRHDLSCRDAYYLLAASLCRRPV
jgi:glycosyltransferase involved in cell wall biosynthesis